MPVLAFLHFLYFFFFNVSFQHGKGLPIASVKPNDLFEEYAEVVKVLADEDTDLDPCISQKESQFTQTCMLIIHLNFGFIQTS